LFSKLILPRLLGQNIDSSRLPFLTAVPANFAQALEDKKSTAKYKVLLSGSVVAQPLEKSFKFGGGSLVPLPRFEPNNRACSMSRTDSARFAALANLRSPRALKPFAQEQGN
jgi:hypothetical protein